MKLTRWTVALYMSLVFLCGGVAGAFAYRLYSVSAVSANVSRRSPEAFRKRFLAEMKARLNLSEGQMDKMGVVLEETGRRFREARSTIEPEIKKIREDQRQQISEILNPEQRQEWVKIVEERDRKRESKRRGMPPAPAQ
jgi:uncharacterized membrane protein